MCDSTAWFILEVQSGGRLCGPKHVILDLPLAAWPAQAGTWQSVYGLLVTFLMT